MDEKEIKFIQDQIGYTFKNQELLVQAFTRRSYSMENGGQDNEVLEFIGDKALDFVVVKQLSEEFGHYSKKYQNWEKRGKTEETGTFISDLDEGELTEIKKQLVQKNTLADAIDNQFDSRRRPQVCAMFRSTVRTRPMPPCASFVRSRRPVLRPGTWAVGCATP